MTCWVLMSGREEGGREGGREGRGGRGRGLEEGGGRREGGRGEEGGREEGGKGLEGGERGIRERRESWRAEGEEISTRTSAILWLQSHCTVLQVIEMAIEMAACTIAKVLAFFSHCPKRPNML